MLGLYPTWFEPGVGSGWVIALIATIHVLFSHASVGSAILFAWLARRSVTHNRPEYLSFIRRYGVFLLIFSYVLGSVTGPGIWFSATIASPRGLSALIHTFVWLWATEWVFFVIEVIGVYLLVYLAGRVNQTTYLRLTAIFALSSVSTLLIIVGVLSFMLWPGMPGWAESGSVLQAFFGPNTFAQMFTRVFFMLMISAVVGGLVVAGIHDEQEKAHIGRVLSTVGIVGALGGAACFVWYLTTLPESAQLLVQTRLPEHFAHMMYATTALCVVYFLATAAYPRMIKTAVAATATVVLLVFGLAPEEMAREILRKPWIAGQYVYGNQIIGRDVPGLGIESELELIARKGVLATHPFVPEHLRQPTPDNQIEAGRALALTLCSNCHSLTNTGMRRLSKFFPKGVTADAVQSYLGAGLYHGHTGYMPAMPLPEGDRAALAAFIAHSINSPEPGALARTGKDQ